jgi:hypothetical protein
MGAEVVLSLVVRQRRTVATSRSRSATDDDIARRCKAAVEGWRFRPPPPRTTGPSTRGSSPFRFPSQG